MNFLKIRWSNEKEMFKAAKKEFKSVKSVVSTAILTSVNVILSMFNIPIAPPFLTITFGFLAVSACGFLYGPLLTGVAGGIVDLIKFIIKPTGPFMIGFTLVEFMGGFLYGLFLYKKEPKLWRCFLAKAVVIIICNFIMTPFLLSFYYGKKTMLALFIARVPKNLIEWPIHSVMIYVIIKTIKRLKIN